MGYKGSWSRVSDQKSYEENWKKIYGDKLKKCNNNKNNNKKAVDNDKVSSIIEEKEKENDKQ